MPAVSTWSPPVTRMPGPPVHYNIVPETVTAQPSGPQDVNGTAKRSPRCQPDIQAGTGVRRDSMGARAEACVGHLFQFRGGLNLQGTTHWRSTWAYWNNRLEVYLEIHLEYTGATGTTHWKSTWAYWNNPLVHTGSPSEPYLKAVPIDVSLCPVGPDCGG